MTNPRMHFTSLSQHALCPKIWRQATRKVLQASHFQRKMEGRDKIRMIAEAALRNIGHLTQLVGPDLNSTPLVTVENSAGSLKNSSGCGPVRPNS